jgi:GT2 family glycosyltransferase
LRPFKYVSGVVGRALTSWREGRLEGSPRVWAQHLRNYYRELEDLPVVRARPATSGEPPAQQGAARIDTDALAHFEIEQLVIERALRKELPHTPTCSIVIPVFNKDLFTLRCLRSLLLADGELPFEIIVVDNGSSDHTRDVLARFRTRVRVISNEQNLGFVPACNQGWRVARGDYVVFLNNDTEVSPRWLDELVTTARELGRVGAVGAKLVYPDGRLQEAGGIVLADASAANYGCREEPDDPSFDFLREVDYCSAACLLVRRDLLERLGGLDTRYTPAYWEDTDLCFGVRQLGHRVLYQPRCRIIHHEGATAGTDVSSGYKRYQVINQQKFREKWRHELSAQRPPGTPFAEAADRCTGPRILFIDHQLPHPDEDSGSVRMFAIVKLLAQQECRVSFLLRRGNQYDRYARALGGVGVAVRPEESALNDLAGGRFDLVVMARWDTAEVYLPEVRRRAPNVPIVFDTVDVHFVREQRMAEIRGDSGLAAAARATRTRELAIARTADLTLVTTIEDREHMLQADPSLRIEIMPNIHARIEAATSLEGRAGLMFIGGFAHPPNVDAMVHFVHETLPLVRREAGPVRLTIVGSRPTQSVLALESEAVEVIGYVPDPAPYYLRSRVFVAPLRFGAGMKGKIGEALSHGVPVVTTPVGAEGLGLVHEETALVAESTRDFAKEVTRLCKDDVLWGKLSSNGQRHVEAHFGLEAVRHRLDRLRQLAFGHRLA